MSLPPIFPLVNVPAVQALLKSGNEELRFFSFGRADENTQRPYAVWQFISAVPENFLADRSNMDAQQIQIDVYASKEQGAAVARAVAEALRTAVEVSSYVVAIRPEGRDPQTQDYVSSFDVDFWTPR